MNSVCIAPIHSSGEGEGELVITNKCRVPAVQSKASGEWSDDEFERDMECELLDLLETVASPDVVVAAAAHRGRGMGSPSTYATPFVGTLSDLSTCISSPP